MTGCASFPHLFQPIRIGRPADGGDALVPGRPDSGPQPPPPVGARCGTRTSTSERAAFWEASLHSSPSV